MLIQVNRNHIKAGKRNNAYSCPIALALKDAGCSNIAVGKLTYDYTLNGVKKKGNMPAVGSRFVKNFDDGKKVAPISINL